MNRKNRHLLLIPTRRGAVYGTEKNEEAFIINNDGEVVQSILPLEKKKAPLFGPDCRILYIDRTADIIGLCGSGIFDAEKNAYFGTWGRFFGHFASPGRFISMHAADLADGKTPETILSEVFRPFINNMLAEELSSVPDTAELKASLNAVLKDEALRHGIALECYVTEFIGYPDMRKE